jgi:glucose-1-phosphate cytidylyltransferase
MANHGSSDHVKVAILAGGLGTRLAEETDVRPKAMVEIGERPIIWHIMKHYETHGFADFYVALGYKGESVKRYFRDYSSVAGSLTVSLKDGSMTPIDQVQEQWTVNMIDTGVECNTGGRLKRLVRWLGAEPFLLTYGDGVSDIDIRALLEFHRRHGKLATITAVHPPSRFGELELRADGTVTFTEKPQMGEGWINGGFMVLEPAVLDLIESDSTSLEAEVLEQLGADGQLVAYKHEGFWQCMDTLRDLRYLRQAWDAGNPPWMTWR